MTFASQTSRTTQRTKHAGAAARVGRVLAAMAPVAFALAGCSGGGVTANPTNSVFSIAPGTSNFDTNCTGCNATAANGTAAEQFTATLTAGGKASVTWSVSSGDDNSGPGTISSSGLYTPPSYLTANSVDVVVKATLSSGTTPVTATSVITLTPGFLQPLTPENAAVGANGTLTVTGYIAEAGGSLTISYALASSATGSTGGQGTLGTTSCHHNASAFTWCAVTYTAPATVASTGSTWLVGRIGSTSVTATQILLNTSGVTSNPVTHEAEQSSAILLGSSGGNNKDYDTSGNQIVDCCSGTLGALVEDSAGRKYLLSNNHVLARSDRASVGDAIIQPGLIDNSCTPNGEGSGTNLMGALTAWLPLSSSTTNADAAIAQVNSGTVSSTGSILELGALQSNGTLAAAPPGISSSGGKGETASLALKVAKSGRTTGLTCGAVSAVSLDVQVSYYGDCAETKAYLTKTFKNQIAISGNQFSDAGDSGALVVDAGNAEPVGLFFAGGTDASGVGQGVANPATDVLSELGTQAGTSFSFVGTTDHAVSCMNYGNNTVAAAQARAISTAETARTQTALGQARMLVNPSAGILGVAAGKSSDRPGEGAVIVYVDGSGRTSVPATIDGVRTVEITTSAHALALGTAPQSVLGSGSVHTLSSAALAEAIGQKQQIARGLFRSNPAFFAVGVGQSLDNPAEAALVIYVDRRNVPAALPATVNGMRTCYVVMNRFHVTRSYATAVSSPRHCRAHTAPDADRETDLFHVAAQRVLKLF
ncbi:MAG: hypothetical protein P4L03_03395 [Terracidiphilus sp.]|nr:hypothetical protein [Terracidiphilus sp.]